MDYSPLPLSPQESHDFAAAKNLPAGVQLRSLATHRDQRGDLTELFRAHWDTDIVPVQWNLVRSSASVLRGVHLHLKHSDYLTVVEGRMSVGLRDLRRDSPTAGAATVVELHGDEMAAVTIPPGIAHGFFFHGPAIHLYAVSEYWDVADELGCHWTDPALEIPWPMATAVVSARDAALPPLSVLLETIAPITRGRSS